MRKTIKLLFVLTLGLMAQHVEAQNGPGGGRMSPEERAKNQTEQMSKSISLSTKQKEKVGEINLKYAEKMSATRKEYRESDRTLMREKMTQIRMDQDAELKTVLTSEQFEQWKKLREERRSQRGERSGHKKTDEDRSGEEKG